jgi:DNA topoisomerase VI subunit B
MFGSKASEFQAFSILRRKVIGMATQLQRLTAEISRASEFFSIKELQAQTGQAVENFATVIVKELLDNALDGCESAGVQPEIFFDWAGGDNGTLTLSVADNGAGISLKTIERIIDFSIRVSDKLLYRSPSRGAQGNALKTVIGMPFALGSDSPVVVDG